MTLLAQFAATGGSGAANYIEDVFSTYLYTGTGAAQTITNGVDLAGKGGLVWLKPRNAPDNHVLWDTLRGATKGLISNNTDAEFTQASGLTSFNSAGFTVGTGQSSSSTTYVSWTFREQAKFFDVVTYTGNGVDGRFINHSLTSTPGAVFIKRTDTTSNWAATCKTNTGLAYLRLNSTAASEPSTGGINTNGYCGYVDNTTFGVYAGATDISAVNASGGTYVAYLFAHNAGGFGLTGTDNVISCGSFVGAASVTVNLGYEPQWILYKRTTGAGAWCLYDTMRGLTASNISNQLNPNSSAAEVAATSVNGGIVTSTGFNINADTAFNAFGETFIYIAIRRGPMKVPTTGTSVFSVQTYTGDDATRTLTTGFPVDLAIGSSLVSSAGNSATFSTRLTGTNRYMNTSSTGAEVVGGNSLTGFDIQTGVGVNGPSNFTYNLGSTPYVLPALRRAPNFFDVVCYTGDGVNGRTVSHNLTVAPELIIVKNRSASADWAVYANGPVGCLILNATNGANGIANFPVGTPTATTFAVASSSGVNGSGNTFVAHLFATCPGVSKVGSYTGTATTQQIDCGFTAGSRFILIKRTDSTGDWYVWDSARGIVAGNDPYLLWNANGNQVTGTDYVDTYAAGFELTATAPAAINASGGSYIFLAIA